MRQLSKLSPLGPSTRRTLDYDIESLASGYGDPDYVPSTVTAWAFAWTDNEDIIVCRCLPIKDLFNSKARAEFLRPLIEAMGEADVWTGHNLLRFDIPVLVAECMRLELPVPQSTLVQDTMRIPRGRGFRKGQDNLEVLLKVPTRKKALNWQEWQEAYGEPGLGTVGERVTGDVKGHMQTRRAMIDRGWLGPPKMWNPGVQGRR